MTEIREYLKDHILLFDGGFGTYYSSKKHRISAGCELACLSDSELVKGIHEEYLKAGSKAISTDTFGVNRVNFEGDEDLCRRTVSAACRLAKEAAAPYEAYVFADIGPVFDMSDQTDPAAELIFAADLFLENGMTHFLFETQSSPDGLCEAAAHIREKCPEAFITVSFAVQPDGFTRDGCFAADLIKFSNGCNNFDAAGFNCSCGARHMLELVKGLDHSGLTLSLMPNAGYPIVIGSRTFYDGDPDYFARQLAGMAAEGARILGGCCGTTPLHIAKAAEALQAHIQPAVSQAVSAAKAVNKAEAPAQSPFWEKLSRGDKVVAVELDPPDNVDLSRFMSGAWQLKGAGVDIITIADCPIARARMDSSILACKLHRDLGIDALPHMTCRDRNLNATKALILGQYAEGIRNVLLVTGDPIPTAERDEVKSVYQCNSRKLAAFVKGLEEKILPSPMHIFGALDLNCRNFDVQLRMAKQKLENGMTGFLTQPVLSPRAFANLQQARRELNAYILAGIIPIVSERNARFMDSEINGISVDPQLFDLYKGKTREESEALAISISTEIAEQVSPYCDGFYLMTPFGRTGLISAILKNMKDKALF